MHHFDYVGDYFRTALLRGGSAVTNALNAVALVVPVGVIAVISFLVRPDPASLAIVGVAGGAIILVTHYGAFLAYQSERRDREQAIRDLTQEERGREVAERERDRSDRDRKLAERERDELAASAQRSGRIRDAIRRLNELATEGVRLAEADPQPNRNPISINMPKTEADRRLDEEIGQWDKRADEYHARVRSAIQESAPEHLGQWDASHNGDRQTCLLTIIQELRGRA